MRNRAGRGMIGRKFLPALMNVSRPPLMLLLPGAAALLAGQSLKAQTWDGGGTDNTWGMANNWNPNAAPANDGTANIIFGGVTRLTPDLNAHWAINALSFANPSGLFVLGSPG